MSTCTATTKTGAPCQAHPPAGSELCALHDPAVGSEARAKGRQAAAAKREKESHALHLDTPEQVRELIQETAQRLRDGKIPAATAVALDRLARTALAAIDSALLEEAQAEIAASKTTSGVNRRR